MLLGEGAGEFYRTNYVYTIPRQPVAMKRLRARSNPLNEALYTFLQTVFLLWNAKPKKEHAKG